MHPWLLTTRALGRAGYKHTGLDLETMWYALLAVALGWTPTWELGVFRYLPRPFSM